MTAFVVNILKVRSLNLKFFARIKKELISGQIEDMKHGIPIPLKYQNFMFHPSYLVVSNYGSKDFDVLRANYTFFSNFTNEIFLEANVDFFWEQNLIIKRNRFSIFKTTEYALFNLSKLLETNSEFTRFTLSLAQMNITFENIAFPLRNFAKNESHQIKITGINFSSCVNFLELVSPNDPFGEKLHNATISNITKEKLYWAVTRPAITNALKSIFFPTESGFNSLANSFKFMKTQFEISESAIFANSMLNKLPLVECLLKNEVPKNEAKFWDDELELKLTQYLNTQKTTISNPLEFKQTILFLVSGLCIKHKSKIFSKLIDRFNLRNATKPTIFSSQLEFEQHIDTFLVNKIFKEKLHQKNYVYFLLKVFIYRISPLYFLVNSDEELYYNFLLFPITIQNIYLNFNTEEEINREYFKTKFLEVHLLKVYIKIHVPELYTHILRIGSSIEDLFIYDLLTFFVESFSINFAFNLLNFYSVFEFYHEDKHFMIVLFNIFLIENMLKKHQDLFLLCKTNSELLDCKRNIFKYQDISFSTLKTDDLFAKIFFKIISLPIRSQDIHFKNDFKINIFSSFETFADYLTETLDLLNTEYAEIDYNYFELSDVLKLFNEIKFSTKMNEAQIKNLNKHNFEKDLHRSNFEETNPIFPNSLFQSRDLPYTQPLILGNNTTFDIENVNMFYPEPVKIVNRSSEPLIRIHFEDISSPLFTEKNQFQKSRCQIEGKVNNEVRINSIYDLQTKQFVNKDRYFEIKTDGSSTCLSFCVLFDQIPFTGIFDMRTFYQNVLEPYSIPLLNKHFGTIFLSVLFVIESGNDTLFAFKSIDISHDFCIDRLIKTDTVYRPPILAEMNSVVQQNFFEFDLLPFLKSAPIKNPVFEFVIQKTTEIFKSEIKNFPFLKILMYLVVNAVEKRDNSLDLRLDAIWNLLTYYEQQDEYISFETATYAIESIYSNYFPFITPFIFNNISQRIFSGYVGRCLHAVLLNEKKRKIIDITKEMNDMIIQFQIYQNSRYLNFANSNFLLLISKMATSKLKVQEMESFEFVKLDIYVNNNRQIIVIPIKMKYETDLEYLLKKGKTSHLINFNNNFLIDKITFKKVIQEERLLMYLLEEKCVTKNIKQKTRALLKIDKLYLPCSFINSGNIPQSLPGHIATLQNIYLNQNELNPWTAMSTDLIL